MLTHRILNLVKALILVPALLLASGAKAQLITDNTVTPEQALLDYLLGDGVEISNITFSGDLNQIGSFDANATNIAIPDGIMLATGDIDVAIGPNDLVGASLGGSNFGAGDPDLTELSTFNTNDAAILEFDFVPSGDSLVFNYIFASEEYNEYVCGSVNDAFGFFLSGPGIVGPYSDNAVNLATIPNPVLEGETIPVTINSVNNGQPGSAGTASNCNQVSEQWNLNTEYYVDNANNNDPTSVQFDGFTVILTAAAQVQCGQTYHIKIAIADAGDTAFDSAVFLEGGSFSSNSANIEASASLDPDAPVFLGDTVVVEGCNEAAFTVFRPVADLADTLSLTVYGTAESGVDFVAIDTAIIMPADTNAVTIPLVVIDDNIEEGPETVTLEYLYINLCGDTTLASATLVIQDPDPLLVQAPDEIALCPPVEIAALVTQGYAPFIFGWSTGDSTATIEYEETEPTTITLTVTDVCGDSVVVPVALVEPAPLEVAILQLDEPLCPGDPVQLGTEVLSGTGAITWVWSDVDNATGGNATVSPMTNQNVTVNAEDACGETASALWTVQVPTYPPIEEDILNVCPFESSILNPQGGTGTYTYTPASGAIDFPDASSGFFTATVEDGSVMVVVEDECENTGNWTVNIAPCAIELIPNVITPFDGNAKNRYFELAGLNPLSRGPELSVFNRWGEQVLYDEQYSNGSWPSNNELLSPGVYYVMLTFDSYAYPLGDIEHSGNIEREGEGFIYTGTLLLVGDE